MPTKSKRKDIENISSSTTEEELAQFYIASLKRYCKQNGINPIPTTSSLLISTIKEHLEQQGKENQANPRTTKNFLFIYLFSSPSSLPLAIKKLSKKKKGRVKFSVEPTKHYFASVDPPSRNVYDIFSKDKDDRHSSFKTPSSTIQLDSSESEPPQLFSIYDSNWEMEKVMVDTNDLTNSEIIAELTRFGLSTKGTKKQRLMRLEKHLEKVNISSCTVTFALNLIYLGLRRR